jgi:hypothetical protein
MKILLDENINRSLKKLLPEYEVYHVRDMGWLGKKNGELLSLANENGFNVFISNDAQIKYQQNLSKYNLAFIIFKTKGNEIDLIMPLIPSVKEHLGKINSGNPDQKYIELF